MRRDRGQGAGRGRARPAEPAAPDEGEGDEPEGGEPTGQLEANVAERKARLHLDALLMAERTMLGWVRSGIQLMALGFMLSRFEILLAAGRFHLSATASPWLSSRLVGALVIVQGAAVCVLAAIRYLRAYRAIERGEPAAPDAVGPVLMAIGNVATGALLSALVLTIMAEAAH